MEVNHHTTTTTTTTLPLIRNLASCNTTVRTKALKHLTTWLPTQPIIPDDDMKKLWKGLFYSLWHADKTPVQSSLINKLCSLLLTLDIPLSIHYLSSFFTTLVREWPGIDVLRLDKFYLLIRRFVSFSFKFLKKHSWDLELCRRVMSVYEEKGILGNGVGYHVVSVFLDEMMGYLPVSGMEVFDVFEVVFKPLVKVLGVSQDKVLVGKVKGLVFDRLLSSGKRLIERRRNGDGDGDNEDGEVVNLGTIALKMGFAGRFYELGASSECFQGNRKVLFGLNKEFLKLEKELEASGLDVQFPVVDEDVPDLVPIVADESQKGGSGLLSESGLESVAEGSKKSSKKKKKKKKVGKEGSGTEKHEKQETGKENDDANMIIANGDDVSNGISFTEIFKSNLQKEFEKVAEEDGLDKDGESSLREDLSTITISSAKVTKKRKRVKSVETREASNVDVAEQGTGMKSGEKSAKKVRFSKDNLVWKPQSPLPPQSLRIPPSVTPRGSALKKGVPPGPIREMPPAVKKVKKKKMKARKVMKTTSPAMKRLRKLQTHST